MRVTLPAGTPAAWAPSGETLHVALRRAGRVEPIVDTSFVVGDSLAAAFTVPLAYRTERFVVLGEARYDGLLLFLGFDVVQLQAEGDTTITIAADYVGPGSRAASYALGARDSTLGQGDTASLVPVVRDSAGLLIPNVPARYVASNPAVVAVDAAGTLTGQAGAPDTARVTGYLPTGLSSSLVVRRVPPFIPGPGKRTWQGNTATWSEAANWDPPGAPTAGDTVEIPSSANDPVLDVGTTVAAVRVTGGNLTLNGHALTVAGDFSTENGSGSFTMDQPADTLRVLGNAVFHGAATDSRLTDGVLYVAGAFEQRNDGDNWATFQARGDHRTVLNGSAQQRLRPEGALEFGNLEIANSGGVRGELEQEVEVDRVLRFTTPVAFDGFDVGLDLQDSLVMVAGSSLTTARVRLSGGMAVAGSFNASTVEFAGDSQAIQPGLNYQNVEVTGDVRLVGPTTFAGYLVIEDGGNLTLNGQSLSVPLLNVGRGTNGGKLTMQHPADVLTVTGDAIFEGDTTAGLLTNGTLYLAGDLLVTGGGRKTLRASGNHRTVWNSTGLTQNFTLEGRATFGHFEIVNDAGVEVAEIDEVVEFTVTGKLRITTPVALDGHDDEPRHVRIDVGDSVVTVAGSAMNLDELVLRGGIAINGGLVANVVEFAGTNQPIPPIDYHSITVSGTARLTGRTTADQFILVRGLAANLTLNGHTLATTESFGIGGAGIPEGTLTMTDAADTLAIGGFASFAGASTAGLLTAGTLIVGDGFFQSETPTSFAPSGTHRVVLNGAAQQRVRFESPLVDGSAFNELELANTAGGLWLESTVRVTEQLRTNGPSQLVASGNGAHLDAAAVDVSRLTLDSVTLAIGGAITRFDSVTFRRQDRTATQLTIAHLGAVTPFTLRGLRFETTPTTGLFVDATDIAPSDGAVLTIDLAESFPADGSGQTATSGGAVVNWTGGGAAPFTQVVAGVTFSCGVTATNVAYCWGINTDGQLGDGTTTNRNVPTPVAGGLSFNGITAGGQHACGVTPVGAIYCWGSNTYGQLGDGTNTDRATPVAIATGLTFVRVSAGDQYTCAVATNSQAYCWGRNTFGQLGDATTTDRNSPTPVDGSMTLTALRAGINHVCAVSFGAAYCWGSNSNGQLGDGTTTNSSIPVAVLGGHSFNNVSPGAEHTCGVVSGGAVYCWGWNNFGQLGDGTNTTRTTPVAIAGGLSFADVGAGGNGYSCGFTAGNAAYCWGLNSHGQLGDGTTTNRLTPVAVAGGHTIYFVSTGFAHVTAIGEGAAYAWGANGAGQLGDGSTTNRSTPVLILLVEP